MNAYVILALVAFFGAILQASLGFGFPIIAIIFLLPVFPYATAVTIIQTASVLGVAYFFFKYLKHVQWRIILPFLITSISVGIWATDASNKIDLQYLKIYLGFVLIVFSVFYLWFAKKIVFKPTVYSGLSLGAISGLTNGFFAISGPPVAMYLLPATNDKLKYIATANAYYFLFKIPALYMRFTNGSVDSSHIGYLVTGLLFMTLGSLVGDRVIHVLKINVMKYLVYGFVGFSGVLIIFQELVK